MNCEAVNDRAKLIYHRLIARRIARDPGLVVRARQLVDEQAATPDPRTFLAEWRTVLACPAEEIRNFIVSRGQEAARLRLSSPFPMLPELALEDESTRRRVWRKARKFARSTTWSGPSGP